MVEVIAVQVVHVRADGVYLRDLSLPFGAKVVDALEACDLARVYPQLDLNTAPVGIFSRRVCHEQLLRDGDRVEVYRPLQADPMQARRRRAGQDG